MPVQITILGLEKIGASIGLGLIPYKDKFLRVGHDRNQTNHKKALNLNAIDLTPDHIFDAVKNADIIVLALPVDEIEETISIIGPALKENAVVLDTSPIKNQVYQWVRACLPEQCYFMGFQPTINPKYLFEYQQSIDFAHADLFENSLFILTSQTKTDSGVVQLAEDMAAFLNAKIFFADPFEMEGLTAKTEILPRILSLVYLHSVMEQPGWHEAQKIAGSSFTLCSEISTAPLEREFLGQTIFYNKENSLRVIDQYLSSLLDVRTMIEEDQLEQLTTWFKKSNQQMTDWKEKRTTANWETTETPSDIPTSAAFLTGLFGIKKRNRKIDKK